MKETSIDILGVRFDLGRRKDYRTQVRDFLYSKEAHTIFTPNAEMVVYAQKDSNFREVLNRSSLNICDGSGPAYFVRLFERKRIKRITGTDFLLDVLKIAAAEKKTVFFLGSGDQQVLSSTCKKFESLYPTLHIVGSHIGIRLDLGQKEDHVHTLLYETEAMEDLQEKIIMAAPDILIVAFGHPKQELFIDTFIEEFPSVKLAMGVGGAFDFYAGKVKRAPKILRIIGLESLWRLVVQPWRWRRVFTALFIFPLLYFFHTRKRN